METCLAPEDVPSRGKLERPVSRPDSRQLNHQGSADDIVIVKVQDLLAADGMLCLGSTLLSRTSCVKLLRGLRSCRWLGWVFLARVPPAFVYARERTCWTKSFEVLPFIVPDE